MSCYTGTGCVPKLRSLFEIRIRCYWLSILFPTLGWTILMGDQLQVDCIASDRPSDSPPLDLQFPITQIALDYQSTSEALEMAAIAVEAGFDWLEIGTPL
ncbi:MAG TPA: hypothetical protein DCQ96_06855, partial [Verrucomicrobiales bacterium]|nr:hypothetical protein [Verrucomicrobiales bacterium]